MPHDKALKRGFTLLEMFYWMTCGSFNTYMVSYLTAVRGVSASGAGLMLALVMASACAGQFILGSLCDKRQNNRRVFIFGMGATILLQLGIYFSPSLWLLGAFYVALGFVQQALSPVLDTWLIRSFPNDRDAYSPIRALGSLSYAAVMVIMGFSVEKIGHIVMPVYSSLLAGAGIFVAVRMPEIPALEPAAQAGERAALRTLPPVVWLFIACMGVMGVANMPLLNMNLLVIENVGGTVSAMGVATAFNTVAEFLVMRFPRPYRNLTARHRMLLAGCVYIASTVMMGLAGSVWVLYIVYFLNGMGYGLILPARRQFVNEVAPENALNRVHSLGDMAYSNFGGLFGNQTAGLLIDSRGVRFMIGTSVCIQLAGVAIMGTFKRAIAQNDRNRTNVM